MAAEAVRVALRIMIMIVVIVMRMVVGRMVHGYGVSTLGGMIGTPTRKAGCNTITSIGTDYRLLSINGTFVNLASLAPPALLAEAVNTCKRKADSNSEPAFDTSDFAIALAVLSS